MEEQHDVEAIEDRANELTEVTTLSRRQATVQAWTEAGADVDEIGTEIGRSDVRVREIREDIRTIVRRAERTIRELENVETGEGTDE